MNAYLLPGLTGLLLGLALRWAGFAQADGLPDALALRPRHALRSGLYALGMFAAMTALLCWLAVIDVDGIEVLPLSAGALAGGALFGAAAGLCGYTPVTAFAGLGGGNALEALSSMAGCLLTTQALPWLEEPLAALHSAPPYAAATLFQTTLDEPFLLGGGFLAQGLAGLLLTTIAACIPSNRHADLPAPEILVESPPEPPPVLGLPAAGETFVASLPGEEPLVVDTAMDEAPPPVRRRIRAAVPPKGRAALRRRLRRKSGADEPPAAES